MYRAFAAVVASLTVLAIAIPAAPAQAAPIGVQVAFCDNKYFQHQGDGKVRAWSHIWCGDPAINGNPTPLGADIDNDSNWGDSSGSFQGADNNAAGSVLNTGTYSGGLNVVKFYDGISYSGGHSCLDWNELYADDLTDDSWNSGGTVNNDISSHKWVFASSCSRFMT